MDGLLVLMVIAWGANYSVLKRAFEEIAARSVQRAADGILVRRVSGRASGWPRGGPAVPRPTLVRLLHASRAHDARSLGSAVARASSGTACYQLFFVGGLARTSVSNAALIIGATPVVVAIMSAAIGRERIGAAALARRGAVRRRHLLRRRSRRLVRRRHAVRRPAHAGRRRAAGRSTRSAAAG